MTSVSNIGDLDSKRHAEFLKRRGFTKAFIAKVLKKRKENLAAMKAREEEAKAEKIAADLATEDYSRDQALTKAIADYNDKASRAAKVEMKKRGMPGWAALIVFNTAEKHGINPYFLVIPNRSPAVVKVRNEAIYRVKSAQPMASLPQIGRWFGRDHTSILHSLAKHSERTGEPRLTHYDLEGMRANNQRRAERRRYEERKQARAA